MKIYKYELGEEPVKLPLMEILDVQVQRGKFVMWAVVNEEKQRLSKVKSKFYMTGQEINAEVLKECDFKKTLQDEMGMVWHVFIKVS